MLSRLRLKGFKSFVDESIALSPLTVLVGANASGKSNLLDAIRFLQGVAMDMSLADVLRGRWEGGRLVWPGLRGGAAEVVRKGDVGFEIESEWGLTDQTITHRIGCTAGDHPAVYQESLSGPMARGSQGPLLQTGRMVFGNRDSAIPVGLDPAKVGIWPTQIAATNRSVLFQIKSDASVTPQVTTLRDRLIQAMRSALFLDITPSKMRDYVPLSTTALGLEGENVSALTFQICQDPEARQDLVDWLSELCAPELEDLDFVKTELGDVMLVLVEKGGRRIPARSMSDGTLRFLGELIALRTAPQDSILLIEEIENGLHPTRAHLLVEAMEAATKTRGVQVIATTHSPLVLNALSPETLRQAVLFARPPDSEGTVLRQLGALPDFDAVCERRGIDRLLSTGWLERAL